MKKINSLLHREKVQELLLVALGLAIVAAIAMLI
jgi:hypothetical protein